MSKLVIHSICDRQATHYITKCEKAAEDSQDTLGLFWMSSRTSGDVLGTLWNILVELS